MLPLNRYICFLFVSACCFGGESESSNEPLLILDMRLVMAPLFSLEQRIGLFSKDELSLSEYHRLVSKDELENAVKTVARQYWQDREENIIESYVYYIDDDRLSPEFKNLFVERCTLFVNNIENQLQYYPSSQFKQSSQQVKELFSTVTVTELGGLEKQVATIIRKDKQEKYTIDLIHEINKEHINLNTVQQYLDKDQGSLLRIIIYDMNLYTTLYEKYCSDKSRLPLCIEDEYGDSFLHTAALKNNTGELLTLIQKGADVNSRNKFGGTVLMYAADFGRIEVVKLLLKSGAHVNSKNKYGKTALMRAADYGYFEVVKLLLQHKANVNSKNKRGMTALMRAIEWERFDTVNLLLEEKADVNSKDKYGKTALMIAVKWTRVNMINLLLEKGALIDSKDHEGWTPLTIAARSGYISIVKLLLEDKANKDNKNHDGWTALMLATFYNYIDTVRLLLKQIVDVNSTNDWGETALVIAVRKGHTDIATLLLEYKADVDSKDNENKTPLMYATEKEHIDIVELLLQKGADVNSTDMFGNTALMVATWSGRIDIVWKLIKSGADVNSTNKFCNTAHMIALKQKNIAVSILLSSCSNRSKIIASIFFLTGIAYAFFKKLSIFNTIKSRLIQKINMLFA